MWNVWGTSAASITSPIQFAKYMLFFMTWRVLINEPLKAAIPFSNWSMALATPPRFRMMVLFSVTCDVRVVGACMTPYNTMRINIAYTLHQRDDKSWQLALCIWLTKEARSAFSACWTWIVVLRPWPKPSPNKSNSQKLQAQKVNYDCDILWHIVRYCK